MQQLKEIESQEQVYEPTLYENVLRGSDNIKYQNTPKQMIFNSKQRTIQIYQPYKNQEHQPNHHSFTINEGDASSFAIQYENNDLEIKLYQTEKICNSPPKNVDGPSKDLSKTIACDNFPEFQEKVKKIKKNRKIVNSHVFREKNLMDITSKVPLSKYLVRMFIKYSKKFSEEEQISSYNQQLAHYLKNEKRNKISMLDVLSIFGGEDHQAEYNVSFLNRRVMWKIIRENMKQEIIFNQSLGKNKRSYFLAVKTYQLRCRSQALVKRKNFR